MAGAPLYSSARDLAADRLVHIIGLAVGTAGALAMAATVLLGRDPAEIAAGLIYSTGLVAMLGFSAAYSLNHAGPRREILRRFDHAAIFIMIAGTYTPFTITALEGRWSLILSLVVWSVAILGASIKLIRPQRFPAISVAIYIILGWLGVVAFGPLVDAIGWPVFGLLAAGGLVYTVGVLFYVSRRVPYRRAVWHGFVLVAAGCHYAAVMAMFALGEPHS